MSQFTIEIKPKASGKVLIEMDAEKFERLAASLGLFNSEFLESLDRVEKDCKEGKVEKIKSLKELRK
ncbi:MAG: hypothetical protein ABH956_02270 [Candidatus Nealsonbacteria bacterium]